LLLSILSEGGSPRLLAGGSKFEINPAARPAKEGWPPATVSAGGREGGWGTFLSARLKGNHPAGENGGKQGMLNNRHKKKPREGGGKKTPNKRNLVKKNVNLRN